MKIAHTIAFATAAVVLTACSSLKETTAYFRPTTLERFDPLPRDAQIPILAEMPRGTRYQTIGQFHFQSTRPWPFFVKSMEFNARRNGANAVLLRDSWSETFRDIVVVPPRTDWVPVTTFSSSRHSRPHTRTIWVPEFRPGYTYPVRTTLTGVEADMVRVGDGSPLN